MRTRFVAQHDIGGMGIGLHILTNTVTELGSGSFGYNPALEQVVTEVKFETQPCDETGGSHTPPAFFLSYDEAQVLMDTLWDAGVRPAESRDHSDTITALKNHLRDMRELAFKNHGDTE